MTGRLKQLMALQEVTSCPACGRPGRLGLITGNDNGPTSAEMVHDLTGIDFVVDHPDGSGHAINTRVTSVCVLTGPELAQLDTPQD